MVATHVHLVSVGTSAPIGDMQRLLVATSLRGFKFSLSRGG
jgi:hypothetical protein